MRIAVINEVSARARNPDIIAALGGFGHEVINVGMTSGEAGKMAGEAGTTPGEAGKMPGESVELTYIHTGFMAAALLNLGLTDLVIGGCGTGQGFLNSAMQYPNVFCGLIMDPLDAFLFSQINAGNCISLALNKGYGWAGGLNLKYVFEKMFENDPGGGYPPERSKSQQESRFRLQSISRAAHRPFEEIVASLDKGIIRTVISHEPFFKLVSGNNYLFEGIA